MEARCSDDSHLGYEASNAPEKERNPVYYAIRADSGLDSRYLTEDVPCGLVPWGDMARWVGVGTPICTALIDLANSLLGRDFRAEGQTLARIGLGDLSVTELQQLVEEGT